MTDVATAASEDWTLERYRPGDEAAVMALFATVFGHARTPEHWNWQFRDNPYGGPFISLARAKQDGALVGSYSVTPIRLNVMGRPVPGCQSVDTAVHPDWRNQRVFEKTARDCYAWCAESGIEAVIGFPNARSYPGFMRTLGWRRAGFPVQYRQRFDLGQRGGLGAAGAVIDAFVRTASRPGLALRRSLLKKQAGGSADVVWTSEVPSDYESLWSLVRSQEVLSVWKDADYLRWRYDRNPDRRFRYACLRQGGELLALAVTAELEGVATICEFLVRGRDATLGRLLVGAIVHEALEREARGVEFIGFDMGFFDEAFEGFDRRLSTANVFCGRAFSDAGPLAELLPFGQNWTVVFGDGDFV
jgi:hypothetical protein